LEVRVTTYEPTDARHTWEIVKDDVPRFERDMEQIRGHALAAGADMAQLIEARHVATDERVTLKCRIPPCECYGQCLMDPPFSPTAQETREVVGKYRYAILTDVTSPPLPDEYWELIQREDEPLCRFQYTDLALTYDREVQQPLWFKLHEIVMSIEREAHNLGYFFAVGHVASTCYLCYTSDDPIGYCDTEKPCRHPYEARPSMEASGIDVFSTYRNAGLQLKMASREKMTWSGLVLIV
jgi:predicted metal-binding protein